MSHGQVGSPQVADSSAWISSERGRGQCPREQSPGDLLPLSPSLYSPQMAGHLQGFMLTLLSPLSTPAAFTSMTMRADRYLPICSLHRAPGLQTYHPAAGCLKRSLVSMGTSVQTNPKQIRHLSLLQSQQASLVHL